MRPTETPSHPRTSWIGARKAKSSMGRRPSTIEGVNLTGHGEPAEVPAELASADLFRVLGLTPMLGRTYTLKKTDPAAPTWPSSSYGLWQRRFGGARDAVGQVVRVNDQPYTIVGVLPDGAGLAGRPHLPDLWIPSPSIPRGTTARRAAGTSPQWPGSSPA